MPKAAFVSLAKDLQEFSRICNNSYGLILQYFCRLFLMRLMPISKHHITKDFLHSV